MVFEIKQLEVDDELFELLRKYSERKNLTPHEITEKLTACAGCCLQTLNSEELEIQTKSMNITLTVTGPKQDLH